MFNKRVTQKKMTDQVIKSFLQKVVDTNNGGVCMPIICRELGFHKVNNSIHAIIKLRRRYNIRLRTTGRGYLYLDSSSAKLFGVNSPPLESVKSKTSNSSRYETKTPIKFEKLQRQMVQTLRINTTPLEAPLEAPPSLTKTLRINTTLKTPFALPLTPLKTPSLTRTLKINTTVLSTSSPFTPPLTPLQQTPLDLLLASLEPLFTPPLTPLDLLFTPPLTPLDLLLTPPLTPLDLLFTPPLTPLQEKPLDLLFTPLDLLFTPPLTPLQETPLDLIFTPPLQETPLDLLLTPLTVDTLKFKQTPLSLLTSLSIEDICDIELIRLTGSL